MTQEAVTSAPAARQRPARWVGAANSGEMAESLGSARAAVYRTLEAE